MQRESSQLRTRATNTSLRATVALLALLAVAAGALAGCGGGGPESAQQLLNDTFRTGPSVQSGRLDLTLSLAGRGRTGLSAPVTIRLSGPFQGAGSAKLPSFDLTLGLQAAGHTVQAGAISADHQFFLQLQGASFVAPASTVQNLERSYAQSGRAAGSSGTSTFAALGIDPGRWLIDPRKAGTATTGGAQTIHLVAGVDVAAFLRDANRLAKAGGSLGLGSSQGSSLSPALIAALAGSIKNATVDVYTGASDHLLRRLRLRASLLATPATSAVLQGLRSATLALDVRLSDVNHPQRIVAPASPRPLSDLVASLSQLGQGSQAAVQGEQSSAEPAPGAPSSAYLRCAAQAGRSVRKLQACAPLLGH